MLFALIADLGLSVTSRRETVESMSARAWKTRSFIVHAYDLASSECLNPFIVRISHKRIL